MHELAIEHTLPLLLARSTSSTVGSTFTVINLPAIDHLPGPKTPNKIIDLINKNRQRYNTNNGRRPFYSIEISPSTIGRPSITLDYNLFAVPPLFTAITWLSSFSSASSMNNANYATASTTTSEQSLSAISLARTITTTTLSHISCHHLTESRLNDILHSDDDDSPVISNILALRGGMLFIHCTFTIYTQWRYVKKYQIISD